MTPEEKLSELGLELVIPAAPMGAYVPVVVHGDTAYVSGHPPMRDGEILYRGRVGEQLSVDDGYEAARLCALNCLGALKAEIGELSRVERILKVLAFVQCGPDFGDQPRVVNGASDLLAAVFGPDGRHARAAVGAPALPAGIAVEVEMVVALRS